MPTRILLRLFLLAGLAAPLCAFALGVGQIEVRSSLNQTFEAEIPLIITNPAELTGLAVRLPRQQDFDRAGVERLELLSKLRFSVRTPPGGPNVIKVMSFEPIREPNFNLLLELTWPRGRLIREFPVQLDPELYTNRRQPPLPPPPVVAPPPIAVAAPVRKSPAVPALPPAPPVSFEGASFYGPVKPGETLAAVAGRVRPSPTISVPQMMAILVAGNPEAFAGGNPNTLRAGATLKVPNPQAMGITGVPAIPPAAPGLAVITPPPAEQPTTVAESPTAPLPPPAPAPLAVEPAALPVALAPQIPPALQPVPAPAPFLSPAEQPREIVPQASIPQPVEPPKPVVSTTPEPAPPPKPVAAPPQPAPPSVARPPAPQPVVDSEVSWISNPVVWVAMALIALAVGSVLLLPLLRRPARPKTPATEPEIGGTAEITTTRTQIREPRSVRSQPIAELAAIAGLRGAAPPAPQSTTRLLKDRDEAGPASKPVVTPAPKPIGDLLKDIDFGLNPDQTVVAGGKDAARDIKVPRFEAEPPTASITRRPARPFATPPVESASKPVAPSRSQLEELPSELRLDSVDFDFGDLGLEKTARPQPVDLPPLEMGRGAPDSSPTPRPSSEPAGPKIAASPVKPASPALQDLKFEFTDVTQEYGKSGVSDEPLRLDAELQNFGEDTLSFGKMTVESGGRAEPSADYVETKLDLATAYLDMGDQVGARSLLDEVLKEGDAAQKQRAGALLKQLG